MTTATQGSILLLMQPNRSTSNQTAASAVKIAAARGNLKPMPVKLSGALIQSARSSADLDDRSVASQVEHWARLGQKMERILPLDLIQQVKNANSLSISDGERVYAAITAFFSNPKKAELVSASIFQNGHPAYEGDPLDHDGIVQVWPNGDRVRGSIVNRQFVPKT